MSPVSTDNTVEYVLTVKQTSGKPEVDSVFIHTLHMALLKGCQELKTNVSTLDLSFEVHGVGIRHNDIDNVWMTEAVKV